MKDENSGRGFWDNFQLAGLEKFPKLSEAIIDTVEAMSHLGKGAKAIDVFKVAMSGLGNVLKAHPIVNAAAAIGAIVAIGNLQGQAFQNKISSNNQTIADSEAVHESSLSLYELYTAYQQASEAADGTAASTQTVASASAALADALGIEKDAIDDLTESYKDKTTAQLKNALIDAELRKNAAANNLTLYADAGNTKSRNEDSFGEYMPDSIGWYMNEYGIDYSKEMSDFDKAEAVVDLYESLSVRQREIAEELRGTGKASTPELESIQQWINILKPYVESYQKAQDSYQR